jgi:hypothetical protein
MEDDLDACDKTEDESDENKDTKDETNWFEFVKEIWQKENKTLKALFKFVVRIIKLSLKLLTPAKIELNLFGGVEDSAHTGWLFSSFILLNSFFENNKKISLNFTPNFIEEGWKFDGHISYCFSIARILLFILTVFVLFPYFSVIRSLHRNKKLIWRKN